MLADLVRRAFEAFNRGDIEGLLELLDPDICIHSLMTEPERADYHGYEGVREWYAAVFEVFPDWRPRPREIQEFDDATILRFDVTATAASSGVRIEQSYWQAGRFRDGLITFYGFYRSEDEARRALGLETAG
jgi:ketosteroid isomerase-like protein